MKKHLDVDDEIDREARARLKHLQEGTSAFDIEYNKTVEQNPPRPRPDLTASPARRSRRARLPRTGSPAAAERSGRRFGTTIPASLDAAAAAEPALRSGAARSKIDPSGTRSTVPDVSTSELAPSTPSDTSLDSLSRTAGDALRRALASSAGSVLSTQVEEDLRSALTGLEALHSHLEDLVSTLLEPRPTPLSLVEAADDARRPAGPRRRSRRR